MDNWYKLAKQKDIERLDKICLRRYSHIKTASAEKYLQEKDIATKGLSMQRANSVNLRDTMRYTMDSYSMTVSISELPKKYNVTFISNHNFLGTIAFDAYWSFDKNQWTEAKNTFEELGKQLEDLSSKFVNEQIPTTLFWPYLKDLCKKLKPKNQVKCYIPYVNYATRYDIEPDWRSNIYGTRYPKYNEDSYDQEMRRTGVFTD